MQKEKLWTKNFIVVSIINFLLSMVLFLLIVTIASYAVDTFNAPISLAGLISGVFILGALFGRLLTGRYIQSIGSKKTLYIGLSVFIVTTSLYFLAFNIPTLFINRFFHGFSLGIASTATGTIIAQIIPESRKGEGIGFFSSSAILSTAIGPLLGILFMQYSNSYQLIFTFNLILAISCLLFALVVQSPVSTKKSESSVKKGSKLSDFIEYKAIPISLVALITGFSYSGIMSFLSFYTEETGLVEAGSSFFLVYAIIIILSRPFTGRLMDKKGPNIVVYPGLVLFALGMLLFSQAYHGFILLLAGALIGLGYGNFNSIAQTIAIKSTSPQRFGLATSTYFIFFDLGLGLGPYIIGFFVSLSSYRNVYFSLVFVIIFAIILYYFLHGRKERAMAPAN